MKSGVAPLLLGALLALATPARADQSWQFRVLLDDSEIGTHDYRIAERDGGRRVQIDARFIVTFLAVEVYRYVHTATERWRGNCLDNIDSRTDDNGALIAVHGKSSGGRFEVKTSAASTTTPGCMMTFAYWNPAFLSQPHLLNSQTGEVMDVHADAVGDETLAVRAVPTPTRTSRGSLLKYVLR
jgi:hypothetical protein